MSLLRYSLPLLCCLGLLRGEGPRGPQGAEPRCVRIPEGSPFFIPTMNLTSALVMWSGTHAPDCRGAPIITVMHEEPWSFKPALGDRVRKGLYGGCIVIDDVSRQDEGFYTLCTSSSQPLLVIELVLTEPSPAVTDPPYTITTVADVHRRLRPVLALPVLVVVVPLVVAVIREPLKRFFTPGSSTGSDVESSTSQGSQEGAKMMNGGFCMIQTSELH